MSGLVKPQKRRVTIKDIAAMANVSIGTVDRVLHNRGEVNEATHERVMSYIEELGYTPNLLAKSLALKKSFTIAALIPGAGFNNPYWEKPIEGLKRAISELQDYNTGISVFYFDAGEENSFIDRFNLILSGKPDGIILVPHFYQAATKLMALCKAQSIPVILIDTDLEDDSGLAYFGQDATQSGKVAARLMHYGLPACSSVLIVNLARNKAITRHMQRREQGFRSYFSKTVTESCIKTISLEIDLSPEEEPSTSLQKILKQQHDIAGIFVTNSRVHKVARHLSEHGKGNLRLIGYDLIDANLNYTEQGIIDFLICQKPEDQGYKAAMAMFNFLLTGKRIERVNYSPIDIIVKENIDYYKHINYSNNS